LPKPAHQSALCPRNSVIMMPQRVTLPKVFAM
jgi:hypothetical protein